MAARTCAVRIRCVRNFETPIGNRRNSICSLGRLSSTRIDCDSRLLSPDGLCPGESLRSWPGRQLQPRPHLAQASKCDASNRICSPASAYFTCADQNSNLSILHCGPSLPLKQGGLARYCSQPSNERDELKDVLRNAPAVGCWRRNWRRRNDHLIEPRLRRRRQKSCHLNIEPDGVVPWRVKVQRKARQIYKFLNRLPGHTNASSNVGVKLSISS